MKLMALQQNKLLRNTKGALLFYQKKSSQWSLLHLLGTPLSPVAIYGYPAVIGISVHNIPCIAMMLINHHQRQNFHSDSFFAAILQSNSSSVALWSGFSTQLLVHCNHCHHSLQIRIGIYVFYKITVQGNCNFFSFQERF